MMRITVAVVKEVPVNSHTVWISKVTGKMVYSFGEYDGAVHYILGETGTIYWLGEEEFLKRHEFLSYG